MTVRPGRLGIWRRHTQVDGDFAARAEDLGYSAIWLGGSPGGDLAVVDELLAATQRLVVATGIVNIWADGAAGIAAAHHRIAARFPGRFLQGIGAGNRELAEGYSAPHTALVEYLDVLAGAGVPASETILAALGPRNLRLAAARTAGAHPYLSTPAQTRTARGIVGDALLVSEHKVVLDTDPERARALARRDNAFYLNLENHRSNLRRLGFTDGDFESGGSDRLWDALVSHGDGDAIAAGVRAHLDAGADQVAVQALGDDPWPALTAIVDRLARS